MVPHELLLAIYVVFYFQEEDNMKNEEITGYTDLRQELFQLRLKLRELESDETKEEDKEQIKAQITETRRKIAKLLFKEEEKNVKKNYSNKLNKEVLINTLYDFHFKYIASLIENKKITNCDMNPVSWT